MRLILKHAGLTARSVLFYSMPSAVTIMFKKKNRNIKILYIVNLIIIIVSYLFHNLNK